MLSEDQANRIADETMGRLTLDEKIGACLTQSWRGSIITPSVVQLIEKLHTGGLRIEPYTTEAAIPPVSRSPRGISIYPRPIGRPRSRVSISARESTRGA